MTPSLDRDAGGHRAGGRASIGSEQVAERSATLLLASLPGQKAPYHRGDACGDERSRREASDPFPVRSPASRCFFGREVYGGRSHSHGEYIDGGRHRSTRSGTASAYTTFALVDPIVPRPTTAGDSMTVSVSIANAGPCSGEDLSRCTCDLHASLTRPLLELKLLVRIVLDAGASKSVRFDIPVARSVSTTPAEVRRRGGRDQGFRRDVSRISWLGNNHIEGRGPVDKAFDRFAQLHDGSMAGTLWREPRPTSRKPIASSTPRRSSPAHSSGRRAPRDSGGKTAARRRTVGASNDERSRVISSPCRP